jgi:hypothetical protein
MWDEKGSKGGKGSKGSKGGKGKKGKLNEVAESWNEDWQSNVRTMEKWKEPLDKFITSVLSGLVTFNAMQVLLPDTKKMGRDDVGPG